MLRRRKRFVVRYSSLALVREAAAHQSRWRRHLPFGIFLLALASLMVALSRPVSTIDVPIGQSTVILTVDISRSMLATDISPYRLAAAEDAALSFIQDQPPNTQIGIVVFAGFAELIQPPTTDRDALQAAIESLTTARRTAIGSGILEALNTIAEIDNSIAPVDGLPLPDTGSAPGLDGTHAPHIIVLLTDGVSNTGPSPLDAAQQAADRRIRVYTIGFGTELGSATLGGPQGGDPFGGGQQNNIDPQFSGGWRRGIDEDTLKAIAELTGGSYYPATSANELKAVFAQLPTTFLTKQETMEISVLFAAAGAVLALAAISLSILWHPVS
jgi:Ca-activated chloride channel family protein